MSKSKEDHAQFTDRLVWGPAFVVTVVILTKSMSFKIKAAVLFFATPEVCIPRGTRRIRI